MYRNSLELTVLLVHQDLEGVHLVALEGLSDLLTHLLVRQLSVHEAVGVQKYGSEPTDCRICVCVFVRARQVPASAALLHDLGPVVARQFAEAVVAVDDGPVHDLGVPQNKVGVWPQEAVG